MDPRQLHRRRVDAMTPRTYFVVGQEHGEELFACRTLRDLLESAASLRAGLVLGRRWWRSVVPMFYGTLWRTRETWELRSLSGVRATPGCIVV